MKAKILSALLLVMVLCSVAGAASLPSVTMLSTKTCPACEQMAKVLNDIKAKYGGKVSTYHYYLEDKPELAKQYNVRYVPMLIFRDASGRERAREVGYKSIDEVISTFRKAGITI
ncbi:MAG: thioredoxin family protein [Synergistaceae bacterium]|nr:thioredoxin family protein [Synergistaceae bacterium]MBQ6972467.1 thioredoxin family protein [Synergistaceae bacterium]